MRNRLYILLLALLCCIGIHAEMRVVLRSSEVITGTILFQNDEVVVIKDAKGNRYQYPMSEVALIEEQTEQVTKVEEVTPKTKKVGIMLQVVGGGLADSSLPDNWGGNIGGKLLIGANNLLDKRIFLGGGVGYSALMMADQTFSILPIELYTAIPCMQTKHAPYCGLGIGYGLSLNKNQTGGMFAEVDLGWRVQVSANTAMLLGVNASFQQIANDWSETIMEDIWATNHATHTLCGVSAKIAFIF